MYNNIIFFNDIKIRQRIRDFGVDRWWKSFGKKEHGQKMEQYINLNNLYIYSTVEPHHSENALEKTII